jgi:hypothetical protein
MIDDKGARARLEVGAVDLDRNRVNVRAHGRILRAVRDFEALLDIMPEEYQSHAATTIDAREVVEVHRRGIVLQEGDEKPADVTLDALAEEGQWHATAPCSALLDPLAMSLILQNTAGLRFDHFTDTGGAPLAELGLDPPDLTFELVTARGETVKLILGRKRTPGTQWWNGMRVGDPHVWSLPGDLAMALAVHVGDLIDRRLHRFPQADIDAVQLSTAEHEVKLEKGVFGWTVAEARAGSRVFAPSLAADAKKVADLLIALDRTEFRTFLVGSQLEPGEVRDAIHVRARGASVGGAFGRAHESGGVRFQRDGDTVAGVVDDAFLELVRTPPQSLWSSSISEIAEVDVQALTVRRGTEELAWQRDKYGVWVRKGRTNEARELHTVLDPLLFLRAARHLESSSEPLEDPIEVRWTLTAGEKKQVVGILKMDGKPQVVCDFDGRRSVLQRQDVHDLLVALFAAPR